MGKGSLRITKNPVSNKQRLLVRNLMGKITLNANFYEKMEFKEVKNKKTKIQVKF